MSAQLSSSISQPHPAVRFGFLDVVGISVSTLLFTIVWVGVFSVFLPEPPNGSMQGLKNVSSVPRQESGVLGTLGEHIHLGHERISDTFRIGVFSLLSAIQTGGSAGSVFALSNTSSVRPLSRVFTDTAVLGAHTTSELISEGHIQDTLVKQSEFYLNSVSFGLFDKFDRQIELAVGSVI